MTPRIGASRADRSTALAPGLDRPGVNPVPRTGASEATGPPGLEHPGGSGKLISAWNRDWNVRGSNAPGLEHLGGGSPGPERPGTKRALDWNVQGLQKEEETAAARSGEENMNKSKELGREDPKNKSGEEGGEGEEGEADKRMEPRLEHPGKQRTRTGTSGWWRPWTGMPGMEATLGWSDGAA